MTRRNSVGLTCIQIVNRSASAQATAGQRYCPVMRLGQNTGMCGTKTWLPTTMRLVAELQPMCPSHVVSKKDPEAVGCIRTHSRNDEEVASTSLYHAEVAQLARLQVHFGHALSDDLPLVPWSTAATHQHGQGLRWHDTLERRGVPSWEALASRHWSPTTCDSECRSGKNNGPGPMGWGRPC